MLARGQRGNIKISDPVQLATDSRVPHKENAVSPGHATSTLTLHTLALEEKRVLNAARAAATSISSSQHIEEYSIIDSKEKDGKGLLK